MLEAFTLMRLPFHTCGIRHTPFVRLSYMDYEENTSFCDALVLEISQLSLKCFFAFIFRMKR